jgi:transglycosylase-like protein with SLT domain
MRFLDRTTRLGGGQRSGTLWLALDAGRTALRAAVLLTALIVALGLVLRDGQTAQGQGIQVDVEQCEDPNVDRSMCDTSSQEVGGRRTAPKPAPSRPQSRPTPSPSRRPSARRPAPGTEVQTYDLATGQGQVETAEGTQSIDLDLSHNHDDVAADPPKVDPQTKPDVSTDGGALPGPGAANAFDFVSSDRALSQFAVPPFLVPIYVAAGRAYGVPWNVLAAINQIETDFGRNLNVSSAGALGWMQFMPSTWEAYGVDASGDGVADPYNPVDAIYAAARYLKASGAKDDLRGAIWSYNHADWYVDIVLKNAGVYGSLPEGLVAETGSLAFGRFPVRGRVSYGDDFRRAQIAKRRPEGLLIDGKPGARAVATQNVTVKRVLLDPELAASLRRKGELPQHGLTRPLVGKSGPPASPRALREAVAALDVAAARFAAVGRALAGERGKRQRPFAVALARTLRTAGPLSDGEQIPGLPKGYGIGRVPGVTVEVTDLVGNTYGYGGLGRLSGKVRPGMRLRGGQLIGRLPRGAASSLLFSTRAAGGALVDPRPLVDGYRLQETADFFHAVAPLGGSPFVRSADRLAAAGIKGGNDRQLAQRVLNDPGIDIYECGRQDIAQGKVDRRVLGALLYLRSGGLTLGISSLTCGHGFYTSGGGVSAHSFGAAVDIWSFNGQPVIGNQGPGSLIEQAMKMLMKLDGAAQPRQLISLMSLGGPSFAMGDHDDHLHIGYSFDPSLGLGRTGRAVGPVDFTSAGIDALTPGKVDRDTEERLSRRLGGIEHPTVRAKSGPGARRVGRGHSEYRGERATAEALRRRAAPLSVQPTAAGAEIVDVDVPAAARGDEAYAVGTVNGIARGWARQQSVLLAHRDGRWRLVGPPRDTRGKIVNPRLRALSTVRGGDGFAVGDKGAIVALSNGRTARLERPATRAKLNAVDVALRGSRLAGYAAGAKGTVVRLAGGKARVESAGAEATNLRGVVVSGGRAFAAGADRSSGTPALFERSGGDWSPVDPAVKGPEDASVRLAAVDFRDGDLWVAGGRLDSKTAGAAAEQPFAARLSGGKWTSFCSVPAALVAIAELGEPTTHSGCDRTLTPDPADSGAATGVAISKAGVMIATSRGPQLLAPGSENFRPVPGAANAVSNPAERSGSASLALTRSGEGWAFDTQGRMARVVPSNSSGGSAVGMLGDWQSLPWAARGKPAAVAVASGGDRALAFGGGGGVVYNRGRWATAGGFGFGLRQVAWAGQDQIVGITEAGDLLRREGSAWEVDGTPEVRGAGSRLDQLVKLGEALGPEELVPGPDGARAGAGLQALSFASQDEGYAVGAAGVIERFDGDSWKRESSNATEDLAAVAAGSEGAIAVGAHGTLLRRGEDSWRAVPDVPKLVGGQPFTAAAALPDGTFLAAAGGAIVAAKGDGDWKASDVAPLAQTVERLSGYRDLGGDLHVLVLVNTGSDKVLLDGDRNGWKPVPTPSDFRLIDAQLSAEGGRLWVVGMRGDKPFAARVQPPARMVAGTVDVLDEKPAPPIAAKDK